MEILKQIMPTTLKATQLGLEKICKINEESMTMHGTEVLSP